MAGCIEDLFTQYLWDFDRLKGLNCSPMEECFQGFAHGCLLYVAITTYKCCTRNMQTAGRYDSVYAAVLRKRFEPEVGFCGNRALGLWAYSRQAGNYWRRISVDLRVGEEFSVSAMKITNSDGCRVCGSD
jgi:hypothetical protein